MSGFKFVDEDPRSTGGSRIGDPVIVEFAEALRANPGRWAEYPYPSSTRQTASALANRITHGRGAAKPLNGGGFESVSRDGVVYVRYVGDQS